MKQNNRFCVLALTAVLALTLTACSETADGSAASGSTLHTVQHMLQGAMLAAVAVGICYSFCVYFAAEPGLLGQNPALYQNVSRLVQFWL